MACSPRVNQRRASESSVARCRFTNERVNAKATTIRRIVTASVICVQWVLRTCPHERQWSASAASSAPQFWQLVNAGGDCVFKDISSHVRYLLSHKDAEGRYTGCRCTVLKT